MTRWEQSWIETLANDSFIFNLIFNIVKVWWDQSCIENLANDSFPFYLIFYIVKVQMKVQKTLTKN